MTKRPVKFSAQPTEDYPQSDIITIDEEGGRWYAYVRKVTGKDCFKQFYFSSPSQTALFNLIGPLIKGEVK